MVINIKRNSYFKELIFQRILPMSVARELANLRGTPTDSNILLQSTAGDAITAGSGTCNIAVGLNAFGAGTTGDDNIAIGRLAIGTGATTGTGNIGLGISALSLIKPVVT